MKQVRAAIVGMGIGKNNARGILANPRGRVVALCDLFEDRMAEFAKELPEKPKFYTDYKEMCKDPDIDAVFVGTPNQYHVPVALEAVRAGKHVLVTKPLADSLKAAKRLVEVAEAAGVVNMMSLSTRFANEVIRLGDMAKRGELGEIYYARARSIRRAGIPSWSLGFIQKGGGAFRDVGVHVLDAVWWLMGQPKPVSVTGVSGAKFGPRGQGYWKFAPVPEEYSSKFEADDYAGGFIRFENNLGLVVESFWASHQTPEIQIELFGTEAGAKLHPFTIYRTDNGEPKDTIEFPADAPTPWNHLADHFIECILDGKECQAPLRHGMIIQEMMEALLASAASGKEVRFK